MSYATELAGTAKTLCVVWDFPSLETRFVTRKHDGLDTPAGWTVFEGAAPDKDTASKVDILSGSLTVGGAAFRVPDERGLVTAWLASVDAELHEATVVRRDGFVGVAEAEYVSSRWTLDDVEVEGRDGGGFRFVLANVLGVLSKPLYEDIRGESYRLDETAHAGGLAPAATTITLDRSPKGIWREPGFAFLYDEDAQIGELVEYQTIGGTGNLDLQSCTRRRFAVGDAAHTFPLEAQVSDVWAARGNPIDLLLRWLTTTAGSGGQTQRLTDPGFENWTSATNLTDYSEFTAGGTVNQDTTETHGGGSSSVRLERSGAGDLGVRDVSNTLGLASKSALWFVAKGSDATTVGVRVYTNVGSNYLQADGTYSASAYIHEFAVGSDWTLVFLPFTSNAANSVHTVEFLHRGSTGVTVWLDGSNLFAGYTSSPNGPYDANDGDGLGVDYELLDIVAIEKVREEYWPVPTFDGSDALTSGTAVLFVERQRISDLKRFAEEHLLRPFALFPAVGADERFRIETYYRVPPRTIAIGDEWLKQELRASRWKRNYSERINNLRLLSDWNPVAGEHEYAESVTQPTSVSRYGLAKAEEIAGRGCRSGRIGFPDYSSLDDLRAGASKILLEAANPPTAIEVSAFYKHKDVGLTDAVTLNVENLPNVKTGARGYDDLDLWIVESRRVLVDVERAEARIEFRLRLRRPVLRPAFVAPNTVASSYSTASASDLGYCYLTPNADAQFANGDEAYTVLA